MLVPFRGGCSDLHAKKTTAVSDPAISLEEVAVAHAQRRPQSTERLIVALIKAMEAEVKTMAVTPAEVIETIIATMDVSLLRSDWNANVYKLIARKRPFDSSKTGESWNESNQLKCVEHVLEEIKSYLCTAILFILRLFLFCSINLLFSD